MSIAGWNYMNVEMGTVDLVTGSSDPVTFSKTHTQLPKIMLTVLSSSNDDGGDYNVWSIDVSLTGFTVNASFQSYGKVNWCALSRIT
jgi:hypothetical protein